MARTQVQTELIATNAISGTIIADNAITAVHIATNAISGTLVQDSGITTTMIAANNVTAAKIVSDGIETRHLHSNVVSGLSAVTAASGDYVLIGDTSDSNNLKKALVSDFGNDLDAAVTINESGASVDFRVESNTKANMLFVDGSADAIGIDVSTPLEKLEINGAIRLRNNATGHNAVEDVGMLYYIPTADDSSNPRTTLQAVGTSSVGAHIMFSTGTSSSTTERMRLTSDGKLGIGTASPGGMLETYNSTDNTKHWRLHRPGTAEFGIGVAGDCLAISPSTNMPPSAGTGMYFKFNTGKIGLGTTSPGAMLDITSGSYNAKPAMMLGGDIDTTGAGSRTDNTRKYSSIVGYHYSNEEEPVGILGYDCQSDSVALVNIGIPSASYNSPSEIRFFTGATSTTASPTQRMSIDSDGDVTVGTKLIFDGTTAGDAYVKALSGSYLNLTTLGANPINLNINNSVQARLATNGDWYTNDGSVSSLSDSRIKSSVADLTDGLSILKQLRPVTYKYNDKSEFYTTADDTTTRYGFVADEVKTIAPQYTTTGDGKVDGVEVNDFKSLSQTKMIPMLVKAIQELETRLAALE